MHASVGTIRTIISKRIKTLNYPTRRQNKLRFARSRRTRIHGIISRTHVRIVTITHALQMQFIARRLSSPYTLLLLVYFSSFYRTLRVHAYYASYTLRVAAVRNRYEPLDVILKVKLGLADDITRVGNGHGGEVADAHYASRVAYHTQTAMGLSPPQRITVMMRVRPTHVKLLPARLAMPPTLGLRGHRKRERENTIKNTVL